VPPISMRDDHGVELARTRVGREADHLLLLPARGGMLLAAILGNDRSAQERRILRVLGPLGAQALAVLLLLLGRDTDQRGEPDGLAVPAGGAGVGVHRIAPFMGGRASPVLGMPPPLGSMLPPWPNQLRPQARLELHSVEPASRNRVGEQLHRP